MYSGYSAIQVDIQGALCGLKSKTIVGENSPWSQGKCINENGGDGKKKTDGAAAERRNHSSKRQQASGEESDELQSIRARQGNRRGANERRQGGMRPGVLWRGVQRESHNLYCCGHVALMGIRQCARGDKVGGTGETVHRTCGKLSVEPMDDDGPRTGRCGSNPESQGWRCVATSGW